MNIKYIVALSAFVMLTGTLSWGAAKKESSSFSGWLTTLWAASNPQLATLLHQMELDAQRGDTANANQLAITALTMGDLEELPPEIIEQIAKFLDPSSLMSMTRVNKHFNDIIMNIPWYQPLIELLKRHKGNLQTALFDQIEHPNDPMALYIVDYLARHMDLNKPIVGFYEYPYTPLRLATGVSTNKIVQILIDHGADVNKTITYRNITTVPIEAAAERGDSEIIQTLINNGANLDVTGGGPSALMTAIRNDYNNVITQLIEANADVNLADSNHETPLMTTNSATITDQLLKAGAKVDTTDPRGMTALMMAARDNQAEKVELLLMRGANANLRDKWGRTALDIAREKAAESVIPILENWMVRGNQ